MSISETHYLRSVVGDTEIRKGEGMELDELFHSSFCLREKNVGIRPIELDILREAFQMRETTPVELSSVRHIILTYLFIFVSFLFLMNRMPMFLVCFVPTVTVACMV